MKMSNIIKRISNLAYTMIYQRQLQWKQGNMWNRKISEDRNQMIEDGKKKEHIQRQKRQCISDS